MRKINCTWWGGLLKSRPCAQICRRYTRSNTYCDWSGTDAAAVLVEGASADGEPQLWIGIVDNKGVTAEKLAAVLRRRRLSYDIKLFDVQTIPRGASGKVNRQHLEALLRDAGHRSIKPNQWSRAAASGARASDRLSQTQTMPGRAPFAGLPTRKTFLLPPG
jgi:hypothetical protein